MRKSKFNKYRGKVAERTIWTGIRFVLPEGEPMYSLVSEEKIIVRGVPHEARPHV